MKTLQKQYDKDKQEQAGTSMAQARVLTLSISDLAEIFYAGKKLPDTPEQRRDRGDGDER